MPNSHSVRRIIRNQHSQRFSYCVSAVLLTLGLAGAVTAYSAAPRMRQVLVPVQAQLSGEPSLIADAPLGRVSDDWRGATVDAADAQISRLHVYFLDRDQVLNGRIDIAGSHTPSPQPMLLDVSHGGSVSQSVEVNADGRFSVAGLSEGVYGFSIDAHETMLAFAVYIGTVDLLEREGYSSEDIREVLNRQASNSRHMHTYSTPLVDFPKVRELLDEAAYQVTEQVSFVQNKKLEVPPNVNFGTASPGTALQEHTILLSDDGHLRGRLRHFTDGSDDRVRIEPASFVDLTFVRDNQIVAVARTREDGRFDLQGLSAGTYSLVATSRYGYAALGIEVSAQPNRLDAVEIENPIEQVSFIDHKHVNTNELALDLALMPRFGVSPTPTDPVGGEMGFMGGSGGAAAGGGGLGQFLLGAALGGLIGKVITDDDCPGPCDTEQSPYKVY